MKHLPAIVLGLVFLAFVSHAEGEPGLKEQKDRDSYSLGYQFGQYLRAQSVDLNLEVYVSAIKDALAAKEPLLSKEEIRATVLAVQQRVEAAREKQLKEMAAKNLEQGKKFLAENQKKEGITALPSGLQYRVLTAGAGKIPQATDTVTVNYQGTLTDGTEFDSSYKRGQPTTFRVDGVIPGWTQALQLMTEGSKWQLFIPAELAYGERGAGPIPPNSTLIFEVELLAVQQK